MVEKLFCKQGNIQYESDQSIVEDSPCGTYASMLIGKDCCDPSNRYNIHGLHDKEEIWGIDSIDSSVLE